MTTWKAIKDDITSVNKEEMVIIDTLSKLQAIRIQRGITQNEFAASIGMSQPQLAKIEKMTSIPSLATLNRYAQGLDMHLEISLVTN
ncbi:helix-turn-helix domain-containing protein [Paucilactobacillus sp. N302-9]